ncbi:MAG TPA: SPFH domain-containing protein [Candidatus Paenibacillus intestinavium]|nr:SPFH domain-containing protein [Candidatus Paenibacillus intestinavium]
MAILSVIKFDGLRNREWVVYRFPGEEFNTGSQLIVGEGQIAVFVRGGQVLDIFSAGTYTLSTNNIPILSSLINLPFGNRTPFTTEIYFINRAAKLDLYWGTTDPITLIDPKYSVRMRVRAHGQIGLKIVDYRVFITELIGSLGDGNIVKYDNVIQFYRGLIVTKIKTLISSIIINRKISVLEIAPLLEEISTETKSNLHEEFDRYGISVLNFYITSINFPDEDFALINSILGDKAAFDIIGDNRYNVKRTFDVMETAAGNEGSGGLAAAGLGLGIGTGAGVTLGQTLNQNVANTVQAAHIACSNCHTMNDSHSKFCYGCGNKMAQEQLQCSSCQAAITSNMKFCAQCGCSLAKPKCSHCSAELAAGAKFCAQCGTKTEGDA